MKLLKNLFKRGTVQEGLHIGHTAEGMSLDIRVDMLHKTFVCYGSKASDLKAFGHKLLKQVAATKDVGYLTYLDTEGDAALVAELQGLAAKHGRSADFKVIKPTAPDENPGPLFNPLAGLHPTQQAYVLSGLVPEVYKEQLMHSYWVDWLLTHALSVLSQIGMAPTIRNISAMLEPESFFAAAEKLPKAQIQALESAFGWPIDSARARTRYYSIISNTLEGLIAISNSPYAQMFESEEVMSPDILKRTFLVFHIDSEPVTRAYLRLAQLSLALQLQRIQVPADPAAVPYVVVSHPLGVAYRGWLSVQTPDAIIPDDEKKWALPVVSVFASTLDSSFSDLLLGAQIIRLAFQHDDPAKVSKFMGEGVNTRVHEGHEVLMLAPNGELQEIYI